MRSHMQIERGNLHVGSQTKGRLAHATMPCTNLDDADAIAGVALLNELCMRTLYALLLECWLVLVVVRRASPANGPFRKTAVCAPSACPYIHRRCLP